MLPYLIAGAIGFGIGKLFENGGEAGEKYVNGGGVGKYKMYKLRAEGLNDFINFLGTGVYFNIKSFTVEPIGVPDVVVSFETNLSLSEIKAKLREVKDSHVMLETIKPIKEYTGERYAGGGETFMAGGIGESDDKYGGQINKIVTELKGMKGGLNNKAPYVFVKEGYIYVSAENGDNYADYYEYTIDEKLEDLADRYNTYWDWETAGSIVLAPIDTDAGGGETFMAGGRITKYVQLYFVQGNYGQGWEDLTAHDNRKDARAEMRVYDDNESYPHRVIQRRVLRTDYEKGKYVGGGEITDADLNYYIYPTKEVKIAYLGKIQMGYFFSLKDALKEIEYLTMAYPKNEIEKYAIITPDKTFHLGEKEYNIRFDNGGEAGGGLPKKRRRSASVQYGRSDTSFDKQLTAKPVGYRFTNAKANQLRKDPYAKPTEAEVKKYLGKGIYKENRKNRSDKDRNAKL